MYVCKFFKSTAISEYRDSNVSVLFLRALAANFQKTKTKSNQRELKNCSLWLFLFHVVLVVVLLEVFCLRVKKSSLHFKWFEVKSPPKLYIVLILF